MRARVEMCFLKFSQRTSTCFSGLVPCRQSRSDMLRGVYITEVIPSTIHCLQCVSCAEYMSKRKCTLYITDYTLHPIHSKLHGCQTGLMWFALNIREHLSTTLFSPLSNASFLYQNTQPLLPQCVLMAHALSRISYSVAEPKDGLLAFVAKDPPGAASQTYCHAFIFDNPKQVKDLSFHCFTFFRRNY